MINKIIDMHAHLSDNPVNELDLRQQNGIITCFSAGSPQEWKNLYGYSSKDELLCSFGIHPWYSDRFSPDDYIEYFKQCSLIGEIGMDTVWCDIPVQTQQKIFERQLSIAKEIHKPVILHTKGCESQIADIMKSFTEKFCVHWYSGNVECFEKFLSMDCYFTLGPDIAALHKENNPLAKKMLAEIPLNRIFLETDGVSAIGWAYGKDSAELEEIAAVLKSNLEYLAKVKSISAEQLAEQMHKNLAEFLGNE